MRDRAALIEGLAVVQDLIRALREEAPFWRRRYGDDGFGVQAFSVFSQELSKTALVHEFDLKSSSRNP
jgi:hypothetical protein